jgi:hypothetical protein
VLTFIVVFVIHTYLMVVVNDTLRLVEGNKVLAVIINLIPNSPRPPAQSRLIMFNIALFWTLMSNIAFGSVARIFAFGPVMFVKDMASATQLFFKSIFSKLGTPELTRIFGGLILGVFANFIVFNGPVSIALAAFLFLSVSQKEKSFLILVSKLFKSDMQRLFKVKHKTEFDLVGFSIIIFGVSLGLLIAGLIPGSIFNQAIISKILKVLIIVFFIFAGWRSAAKGGPAGMILFFLSIAGMWLLMDSAIFADDTGWSESGKNMKGWLNNPGTPTGLKLGLPPAIIAGLVNLLGPMFPGFMKNMLKDPKTNPYDYLRKNLTPDQFNQLKQKVKDYNQVGIDAANAEAEAYNGIFGPSLGSFFEGCGNSFSNLYDAAADVASGLKDTAIYVAGNWDEAACNTGDFVSKIAGGIYNEVAGGISDVLNNKMIYAEALVQGLAGTVSDLVLHPIDSTVKIGESLADIFGINDLINCTDPSKSDVERVGLYLMGIMKLSGLEGAGQIADISKAGVSKLIGMSDDILAKFAAQTEKMTADEFRRFIVNKESQNMGRAFADDFARAVKSGAPDDELMKKMLNIKSDTNSIKALNALKDSDPEVLRQFNSRMNKVLGEVDQTSVQPTIPPS